MNFASKHFLASSVSDYEIQEAAEKFEDSKQLAETAMINLLENEVRILLENFLSLSYDFSALMPFGSTRCVWS